MGTTELNKYITKAYGRLLDFSIYHCEKQHLQGLEYDLLNCVLENILSRAKDQEAYLQKLLDMLSIQRDKWTEFDYYILKTIKFNAQSDTAPFRRQYDLHKPAGTYVNIDSLKLGIWDDYDEKIEHEQDLQEKEYRLKESFSECEISDKARDIFRWKFIEGNKLSQWPGKEDVKELRRIYNGVLQLVKDKLNGRVLF